MAGLPANLLNHLQSVLNASAWSIAGLRHSANITDNLAHFHWLLAVESIKFQQAVIVNRALHDTALRDFSDTLVMLLIFRPKVVSAYRRPVNS